MNTRTIFLFTAAFLFGLVLTIGISGCQNQTYSPAPRAESDTSQASLPPAVSTEVGAATNPSEPGPDSTTVQTSADTSTPTEEQPAASQTSPVVVSKTPLDAVDKNANAPIKPGDWSQWGGTSYRNNTPIAENIPTDWAIGDFDDQDQWIPDTARNIKWVSPIGSQTYGNPVIADGSVYVGTNNGTGWVKRYPGRVDLGCLISFRESDGKFRWQDSSEKLSTGRGARLASARNLLCAASRRQTALVRD